jgi:pyroglutamyl-peptidase
MGPVSESLVLVSGFGPFEEVGTNPSGEIARALAASPPRGVSVRAAVLPVSFARAPRVWDEAFAGLLAGDERPALCLALGVAKRPGFRLERWARSELKLVPRVDVDGQSAHAFSRAGPRLESGLDLARLLAGLRRRGVTDARISRTAGGYVCERIYHHVLVRAGEHGTAGLFVHVPPLRYTALARQVRVVRWVLDDALAILADGAQSPSSRTRMGHAARVRGSEAAKARTAGRKRSRSSPL